MNRQDKLRNTFLSVYQRGIAFGRFNCDKKTELNAIKDHVFSKINGFDELAKKILTNEE